MSPGHRIVVPVLCACLAAPAAAWAQSGAGTTQDDLRVTKEQLDQAERDLGQLERAVHRAQEAVTESDTRLAEASAELALVTEQLTHAEAILETASARQLEAASALQEADATMRARLQDWHAGRDQLAERAAAAYKYGGMPGSRVLMEGLLGASDLHGVAVAARTVRTLVARDEQLVERTLTTARAAAESRTDVNAQRAAARRDERQAAAARRTVAGLVARHQGLVDRMAAERDRRATALAELEQDQAAREVLVSRLRQQVVELQATMIERYLREPVDLDPDGPIFDGPPPPWASALPPRGQRWAPAIEAAAASAGIDGRLLAALVWTESSFIPTAVSHAGAIGLAQLMPDTARGLRVDPYDPLQNLVGGARYLRIQMDSFQRVDLALAAYNAGPGRVDAAGREIPNIVETQLYVLRVLERYERIAAAG